ncbi:MAG: hypothetical protein AAF722_14355, partial [Cyanobacteria bacterium P01_C01_bin.70]
MSPLVQAPGAERANNTTADCHIDMSQSTAQITNRAAMERTDGNLINCLHSLSTGEGQIVCSALRIATFENPY